MLQFEYVRTSLTSALLCIASQRDKPKDESRVFQDKKNPSFIKKPMREIQLDDRTIRVESTPVHYRETRPYKGGKLLIGPDAYRLASWRRAVSLLPPAHQAWVRYCYGDATAFANQVLLCRHVWSAFLCYQRATGARRMSKKMEQMIQRFVWLSVQESKRAVNLGDFSYNSSALAKLAGLACNNWIQNYQPRWNALLQIVDVLDKEALIYVDQKHRDERSARRNSVVPV